MTTVGIAWRLQPYAKHVTDYTVDCNTTRVGINNTNQHWFRCAMSQPPYFTIAAREDLKQLSVCLFSPFGELTAQHIPKIAGRYNLAAANIPWRDNTCTKQPIGNWQSHGHRRWHCVALLRIVCHSSKFAWVGVRESKSPPPLGIAASAVSSLGLGEQYSNLAPLAAAIDHTGHLVEFAIKCEH
jgi:hypothetical protein